MNSTPIDWTIQGSKIRKANLNGTGVTTLVSGQNGPAEVAVGSR